MHLYTNVTYSLIHGWKLDVPWYVFISPLQKCQLHSIMRGHQASKNFFSTKADFANNKVHTKTKKPLLFQYLKAANRDWFEKKIRS